jgi:TldD protein
MKRILYILFAFTCTSVLAGDAEIFQAMEKEIQRAMKDLRIEEMAPPYFISLRLRDDKSRSFNAAFGVLHQENESHHRSLHATVRVGSPEMDNTNFGDVMSFGSMFGSGGARIPLTDDVTALRLAFWSAIDSAYKEGLEAFSKKKGYIENHPQEEYPADFLPLKEKHVVSLPIPKALDMDGLAGLTEKLSHHFRGKPFITEGVVTVGASESTQYYLDSEGNRHVRPETSVALRVDLEAFTKDWYPVGHGLTWVMRHTDELPETSEAVRQINEALAYVEGILDMEPLEEYQGPVIFAGEASGRFFLELLGRGVTAAREPLSSMPDQYGFLSSIAGGGSGQEGFLNRRLGRRILPPGFTVTDRPTEAEWDGHSLMGHLPVDDEGVKSRDIELVKEGKLVALPMRRTATKKFTEINGHARGGGMGQPKGAPTNLFVEDAEGFQREDFMEQVRELASDMDMEEILVITRLQSALTMRRSMRDPMAMFAAMQSGAKNLLSPPLQMHLLNVKTGERKPVWGLVFDGASERILKDIVASSRQRTLYQTLAAGGMLSSMPMSVVAPDILVEEMVLQKMEMQKNRPPLVEMPVLE